MRGRVAWAIGLCVAATGAVTEEAPLPDFKTCLDIEIARFERELTKLQGLAIEDPVFNIARVGGVDVCGIIGIMHCDRSEDRIGCQQALTADQDTLRAEVLGQLPAPKRDAEPDSFAEQLYARSWALAHGMSAGPDCAGTEPLFRAWCEAREANGRLRDAVLTWQVARHLGRAGTAVEAGWASPPPPVRPRPRPEDKP